MKTLLIGIDGATMDVIKPMVSSGQLPHIARLMNNGVYGNLRSVFPPVTFPAWTSFKTGKNPGKHGVFDFIKDVPYIKDAPSEIAIGDPSNLSFWKILSNHGYRVGIVNVPTTYPPEKINGVFVSGFGTPSIKHAFVYPPELKKTLLQDFDYEFDIIETRVDGKEDEFLETLTRSTKKITDVVEHLLQQNQFDLFMVNYMAADQTQHFFFGYKDPHHPLYHKEKAHYGDKIEEIYQLIDEQIGRILSVIDEPVDVMIVSDHGFGPALRLVCLNEWLEKEGYLTMNKFEQEKSSLLHIPKRIVEKITDVIPSSLSKYIPQSIRNKATDYISWTHLIDWQHTKAYSGGYPGKIYVNLKGREKEGIVDPGKDHQDLIDDIEQRIRHLTDPDTGEKVVDRVYRRHELYSGSYEQFGPDLNVIMKDLAYLNRTGFQNGQIFYPPHQGGDHRLQGTFIASGPHIKDNGDELSQLSIVDIAPTILHLYHQPVDADMDGRVLTELFREESALSQKKVVREKIDYEKEMIKGQIHHLTHQQKL